MDRRPGSDRTGAANWRANAAPNISHPSPGGGGHASGSHLRRQHTFGELPMANWNSGSSATSGNVTDTTLAMAHNPMYPGPMAMPQGMGHRFGTQGANQSASSVNVSPGAGHYGQPMMSSGDPNSAGWSAPTLYANANMGNCGPATQYAAHSVDAAGSNTGKTERSRPAALNLETTAPVQLNPESPPFTPTPVTAFRVPDNSQVD